MRSNYLKETLKTAVLAVTVLLLGVGVSLAQVSLTAAPATLTMPDGSSVPMWGYSCSATGTATCAKLNPLATGWSPVLITVPTGQDLTINLTNSLSFLPTGSTIPNTVPTSLVIVGQLGGGLGDVTQRTTTLSPDHTNAQQLTWPIAAPGTPVGTSPVQANRVQSFSTEVAVGTTAGAGQCASPCPLTWKAPRPGTYLIESGTHPSIQGPMGLYGILVVTTAPGTTAGVAYPAVGSAPAINYNADIPLLLSEIDPVQNNAVNAAVNKASFSETAVWSGQPGGCGNPASPATVYQTCYPPAVNYSPLYYLFNGVAFDKTHSATSLFPVAPVSGVTGNVLVRFVNAGLHMHVPSIVGALTGTPTAVSGFSLIAEDGNPLPGSARVQSEVFLPPGKTYDVLMNAPTNAAAPALPVFDRELSLSGNGTARDAGMLAYIGVNGAALPATSAFAPAVANPDSYPSVISCPVAPCPTVNVSDPGKGVIANDINVYGVQVSVPPAHAAVVNLVPQFTLNANGTFVYTPDINVTSDSFTYCGNGTTTVCTTVTLGAADVESASGITVGNMTFTSNVASYLSIKAPGVLSVDSDAKGHPLTVSATSVSALTGPGTGTVTVDPQGGFNAVVSAPGTYTFTYKAENSQGTLSASSATVTLIFPTAAGLVVNLVDPTTKAAVTDYRWIIEEDRTFFIDPNTTTNAGGTSIVPTFGTNFHTSYMPLVATGCVGTLACESGQTLLGQPAVCDIGNGVCRTTASQQIEVNPNQVYLDPTKRYYISVLPGDAATPFNTANKSGGHGMGGAPITFGQKTVTILVEPTPLKTAKLSVFVFEDDFPLNGENDAGGGVDSLSPNEPGLGGFNITLFDDAGGSGDATGQMTYDMFNMPLSNSLSGTVDPLSGQDACPVSRIARQGFSTSTGAAGTKSLTGITSTIVTCPLYEADGTTLSPLAGQAVVANMMPGRYGVVATPGADRIARGEEWLQTNTLDGQKAHDSFLRVGEPSYFQEFGPAGYHVSIGFANPKIINDRLAGVCNGTDPNVTGTSCSNTVTGVATTERMSRTPDERLYSSGDNSSFAFTQCYASLGDPDGEDFAFTKCDSTGRFTFTGIPNGSWRLTVFDQWNDMLVDGLSTPVGFGSPFGVCSGKGSTATSCNLGDLAMNQWQANIYTQTFFDLNGNGVRDSNEPGLALVPTNIRFRDGSYSNFNNTDLNGAAGFNEIFPLFSWYVIETDTTRYKSTGTHVVYDAGGPSDGTATCGTSGNAPCGNSNIAHFMANTAEQVPVPSSLRVPGSVYCSDADCTGLSIATGPIVSGLSGPGGSTGRIDAPWAATYGWQGFSGQNSFLEFGKKPFAVGENGGIHGEVIYASTRPFDDPTLLIHTSWTPDVPGVTINLYQELTAADGSPTLTLVDTTKTSSWDDWAQGFHLGADGTTKIPNMNCPGQFTDKTTPGDLFFFSLFNQPNYLDVYNSQHGGPAVTALPNNSQFKCYDGMHNWNQLQPAPYDGMYQFPSVISLDPTSGRPNGTNCKICSADTTPSTDPNYDPYHAGLPMLPRGKYVVEMVTPPGYELVKEEDKNILIGDNYIAPVAQQFAGLGNIFILPDQAEVSASTASGCTPTSTYACNPQNTTQTLGRTTLPSHEGDTGSIETFWPCVGASRVVPDFISLYPQSMEVSPFAGATRNLCDRKEVTLDDQTSVLAKFWIFTSTHATAHYTGVITDDYTSEFDPFSPQFGEKFSPPNLPISIKDFNGNEVSRTYSDHWGAYNGLNYSTWEVNPPNPTGYAPTMMVTCMNDPGPILDTRAQIIGPAGTLIANPTLNQMVTDPLYNPQYSAFCYEIPFMPGQTQYMDTPVVPTSAFAGAGYNNPDCAYPDATPAVSEVDGDGIGPWVSAAGKTLTINSLGDQLVPNNAYSGPQQTAAPYNQKKIYRNYGFGTQCTAIATGCTAVSKVTIGGVNATISSWTDAKIVVAVPGTVPSCGIQQQTQYGGSTAQCGELVITAGSGKQSIDAVTVTVGGKAPTHIAASASIQAAIDAAKPGDLLMIDPTCTTAGVPDATCTSTDTHSSFAHNEMLLMWKPVRLQGVGAATSIINANAHPAGKLDPWRRQVDCLFGLALDAAPISGGHPYDPTPVAQGGFTCPTTMRFQVDRLPLEATVGWDATLNGNLAEQLQEPTLMGAFEGAAITVLAKGVRFPNPATAFAADTFPAGTTLLTPNNCSTSSRNSTNPFPSNFWCNPSSIDGLGITDSSQGGGGIFVHAWAHNLQIANNRVNSNTGTVSGGISIGQGEFPPAYVQNGATPNADPGSCYGLSADGNLFPNNSVTTNTQLPYCHNLNVNLHNNAITSNNSLGDELFSGTPAGAGGIVFCTGADNYKFQHNWVCGNLSTGDGGGIAHMGLSYNADIEFNSILFNQSVNATIATNGGGIAIMGSPDTDPTCPGGPDADCAPGTSDGTGPNMVINANLIMGNAAESGSGGGIRFQGVNGTEVIAFPKTPSRWYSVNVSNNIIANNVAGWDGAGVSLQDALAVNLINNTIMSNDTTATSGVLFNTLGAPIASSQGPTCTTNCGTASLPQPAGLVAIQNSTTLMTDIGSLGVTLTCPTGHPNCSKVSYPILANNVFWQNRAFNISVGALGGGTTNQQNVVTLVPTLNQGSTGQCLTSTNYWDIGVRGDTAAGNHASGITLAPTFSVLTNASENGLGSNNQLALSPNVVSQYCNGSRVPPELGSMGYQVPPGIADATVPNPIFNLTPAATVDEGNNWINMSWGPLSLTHPVKLDASGHPVILGNYGLQASSTSAINHATPENTTYPITANDFYGTSRPQGGAWDIGAVELITTGGGGGGGCPTTAPAFPTLGTLDNFNRTNANNLGTNWSQFVFLGSAGLRVNTNQAFANASSAAYWNNSSTGFGASQAAAFTFANTTLNNDSLILKATGTAIFGVQPNYIRVRYSTSGGGQVVVETTTTFGLSYTPGGVITGSFANGDTLTAEVDATGTVYVWKNGVSLGCGVTLPAGWTGTGRIGMQLSNGARVDNFAGGTL
jgi:Bacterial Ig domain